VSLYDKAAFFKKKKLIIDLLAKIDNRVTEIENINSDGNGQCVHIDIGHEQLIPISLLGQGFNRLAYLYSGLLGLKAEVGLIDELENVWQGIANIARELDIQLFITTHSYECIQAAAKVFEATPEEFQVIRLERTEDNVDAKCIPGDRVASVLERGWEIR
jgi:AAA15 family ATPase/GTPase